MGERKEVWLRDEKIAGLSQVLQPVADALLEANEEIILSLQDFPEDLLWKELAGCASVGFHLKHIAGFLDRLLTYAEGSGLNEAQFSYLNRESIPDKITLKAHLSAMTDSIVRSIERLKQFSDTSLTEPRKVGRSGLPSSVIGLCVHAAEHTMRHTGQLLVSIRCLRQL